MEVNMKELRNIASRLHCIASQMIDAGHFCPTLERAEIRVRNTGEEIGALVNAINAELTLRDAEKAERERPIDDEWLRSIGFRRQSNSTGTYDVAIVPCRGYVVWFGYGKKIYVGGSKFDCITTRGQLIDLLNALKGGAT